MSATRFAELMVNGVAPKLCRDCKWVEADGSKVGRHSKCRRRTGVTTGAALDMVTGEMIPENIERINEYCSVERQFKQNNMCGPDAIHFVQHEPKPKRKWWKLW